MNDIFEADFKDEVLRRITWEPLEFFRKFIDYNALPIDREPVRVLRVVDEIPLNRMELLMLRQRLISPGGTLRTQAQTRQARAREDPRDCMAGEIRNQGNPGNIRWIIPGSPSDSN